MAQLSMLPEDILFDVCARISPVDWMCLRRVCRGVPNNSSRFTTLDLSRAPVAQQIALVGKEIKPPSQLVTINGRRNPNARDKQADVACNYAHKLLVNGDVSKVIYWSAHLGESLESALDGAIAQARTGVNICLVLNGVDEFTTAIEARFHTMKELDSYVFSCYTPFYGQRLDGIPDMLIYCDDEQ